VVSFAWSLVTEHTTYDEIVLVIGQFKRVVEKQRVSLEHVTLNQGVIPKREKVHAIYNNFTVTCTSIA
jgi:3-methyladenine DNA glycosylase Tag